MDHTFCHVVHYLIGVLYEQYCPMSQKNKNMDNDKDNSKNGSSGNAGSSTNANTFSWHNSGEHPKMGWLLNNSFTLKYYKIYILNPITPTRTLIIIPYVSYSIHK